MEQETKGHTMSRIYSIVQWGRILYRGTFRQCVEKRRDWTEQHGNIELRIKRLTIAALEPRKAE